MPWKESTPMEQRVMFYADNLRQEESFSELCRRYGISRKTGYKWVQRGRDEGLAALEDRSRAPLNHPNAVSERLEHEILQLRAAHPTWGPRKLRAWLCEHQAGQPWPVPSTIGALLARHGLTVTRRRRPCATPNASPLAEVHAANQTWCADFKGWFLTADARRCTPLTISDAHTRYLLRCQGLDGRTGFEQIRPIFDAAFRQFGLPAAIRTDNGAPFASVGLAGLSQLAVWWIKLGIVPERIEPGKPQQNGRHERMHRTLKAETTRPPAADPRAQQRRFDHFVREYNHERPHEALGQRTPASLYQPSPRAYPCPLLDLADYPHGWIVRKVKDAGRIKWDGTALHLSNALTGEYVGLEPTDDGWWNIWFGSLHLARLDERKLRIVRLGKKKK